MSHGGEGAFLRALREIIRLFRSEEELIRADYQRKVLAGSAPEGIADADLLERPTRRFLIDGILRALDWNPDDPSQIAEESRTRSTAGKPLFFDYLGMARSRAPALIVEAKGFDAELPRESRGGELAASEMARLISREIAHLKSNTGKPALLALWSGWLNDLRDYLLSLRPEDHKTLGRLVITAGRWMIIFGDPVAAFVSEGVPDPDQIHCFRSLDEIERSASRIYSLLSRPRLINTLPLTLTLGEAAAVLAPSTVVAFHRGVVIATHIVGASRSRYPSRAIHPALVVLAGGRAFAITDYGKPLEEPRDPTELSVFLSALAARASVFEREVLVLLGRTDLSPSGLETYPLEPPARSACDAPLPGSTAAMMEVNTQARSRLVQPTGERGAAAEYLVITGETWFYKLAQPFGPDCQLHAFPAARDRGLAVGPASMGGVVSSFTASGDPQHCEHDALRGLREGRCHLRDLDTHMCCRACAFHAVCWSSDDLRRLPCPT